MKIESLFSQQNIGISFILILIAFLMMAIFRKSPKNRTKSNIWATGAIFFVVLLAVAVAFTAEPSYILWLFIGLAFAAAYFLFRAFQLAMKNPNPKRSWRFVGLLVADVVVLFLLIGYVASLA